MIKYKTLHKKFNVKVMLRNQTQVMSNIRDNSSYLSITWLQLKAKIWRVHTPKEIKKY